MAAYIIILSETTTSTTEVAREVKLSSGIIIFGNKPTVATLINVVKLFPKLWVNEGNTARVPENEWITILLVDNWQELYKPQVRIYSVNRKNEKAIDDVFDKLHI